MRNIESVPPFRSALCALFLALGALGCAREKAAPVRIAVIPKGTTHEFWKSIHAGANKAAADAGVEVIWKGPQREDDRDEQIKVVEDFVSRGVSGIVIAPMDNQALAAPLEDARRQGIPVVVIDSDVQWPGRVSYVATDNEKGGALGARRLGQILGGTGKVLLLRYLEGSASTMAREKGFLDTLAREFPGIEVVSSNQYGGAGTESAYKVAENLLVSFPQLDGVFCPNESTTFGMLRALEDAGRAGKLRFVGFDASAKLVEALGSGTIDGLVVQNPFAMGEVGVKTLLAHRDGKQVDAVIDTGVVMATPENRRDPAVAALLAPDLSTWLK